MKLVQFKDPASPRCQHLGLVEGDEVIDLSEADGPESVYDLYYGRGGDSDGFGAALGTAADAAGSARRLSLAALLQATGRRVGLYSSPHLHTVRERIQINGEVVGKDLWAEGVTRLYEKSRDLEAIYLKKRVNIYRELRIHLYYKSILKREAHLQLLTVKSTNNK